MDIKFNVTLAKYTSYKVGGCAKVYLKPKSLAELSNFICSLPEDEQIVWLGLGSNVLIRDLGINGAVIHTNNVLHDLEILERNSVGMLVRIGAGVSCAKIAKFCVKHNLPAGIWFAGIPGTMGGALRMNAGAFGGETWNHVVAVDIINRQGVVSSKLLKEYSVGYRKVTSLDNHHEWFVAGRLFFNFGEVQHDPLALEEQINALLLQRKSMQPIGTLNCGSVFKNPKGNAAGSLIDSAQLKGLRVGGAIVSDKHANFIINTGTATAKDIEDLIYLVQAKVQMVHNILLEPEVKIIGTPS